MSDQTEILDILLGLLLGGIVSGVFLLIWYLIVKYYFKNK